MKEEISKFKIAVNEEAVLRRAWKKWERRAPELKTDPQPRCGTSVLPTLLCMSLAHSRGKLHCRSMWGRGPECYRVKLETLADQRKFIEKWISVLPFPADDVRKLLDWGDIGRHQRPEPRPLTIDSPPATVGA